MGWGLKWLMVEGSREARPQQSRSRGTHLQKGRKVSRGQRFSIHVESGHDMLRCRHHPHSLTFPSTVAHTWSWFVAVN